MVHVEALKEWFEPTLPVHHIRCVTDQSHDLPDYRPNPQDEKPSIDESLPTEQKQQLLVLLKEYDSVATSKVGRMLLTTHKIITNEAVPIRLHEYRCPADWKELFKQELDFLLKHGFAVPSEAPWAAPMFAVPKKNGQIRLVVYYRRLNQVTVPDPYVMPQVEEVLEAMGTGQTLHDPRPKERLLPCTCGARTSNQTFITEFGKY